jgi:RNA-directed DNA polymerase
MLSARTGDKLRAISEVARKGRRVKDLRRLMNHPDLWMQAYLNIQGNKGALTRGTDIVTMDGYSPERAANLVELIRDRRYKPKPVRRHRIPTKVAGKIRPLGMPSADDKLVQEVVRMILERIYEPLFKGKRSQGDFPVEVSTRPRSFWADAPHILWYNSAHAT